MFYNILCIIWYINISAVGRDIAEKTAYMASTPLKRLETRGLGASQDLPHDDYQQGVLDRTPVTSWQLYAS